MDELVKLEPVRQAVVLLPLAVVLITCAWTDYKERKVYNKVTYPAFFIGLATHMIAFGLGGFVDAFLAALIAFAIGLFLLATRLVGGGDIKLLIVVGAFLGKAGLAEVTFYSVLAGGVGGLIAATFNGYLWEMLKRLGRWFRSLYRAIVYRSKHMAEELERDERSWIPFAIAILAGGILTWTDAAYDWPGLWEIFVRAWSF
jgi:prepilin peptidase CpaA